MRAVLGISGSRRDASVALSIDGRVVAAVSEDAFVRVAGIGYRQTGGAPAGAIAACLKIGGLEAQDLSGIGIVNDCAENGPPVPVGADIVPLKIINAIEADALQAAAADPTATGVLVASADPPALIAFARRDGRLRVACRAEGWEGLTCAAARLASQLGIDVEHPFSGLDRLASHGEPEFRAECAVTAQWKTDTTFAICCETLNKFVASVAGRAPADLRNPEGVHTRTQETRCNVAASLIAVVADVVRQFGEGVLQTTGSRRLILGGDLFENVHLNSGLHGGLPDPMSLSPVPGHRGRAVGASLCGTDGAAEYERLTLGPAFAEQQIKDVLENCRTDYVYEPDWGRLIGRVSKMLGRGLVIGWFQGPAGFGPTSLGSRSVLCDPSRPYVRENLNECLRRAPASSPLPISMMPAATEGVFGSSLRSPYMLLRAVVAPAARSQLRGATDANHCVQFHTATPHEAPELCELLEVHRDRTGVPALINLNLVGLDEPTACSPRDALRTFYSSAIDALVIGRFLLMKDHWLLRNDLD